MAFPKPGGLFLFKMKYIPFILALTFAFSAKAQNDVQRTPGGASYKIFTDNKGEKIKVDDVVTFDVIQKTDKDSILMSSYATGSKAKARVVDPKSANDFISVNIMQVFPLLTLNDSVFVKIPTDSLFKGHEAQRPPFFPAGSGFNFYIKIERIQSLTEAMAELNAEKEKAKAAEAEAATKNKVVEDANIAKYVASHKMVLKTTASGLKYVITRPSLKPKPLTGDTLLVNYAGHTLDGKVFDSSIEAIAKQAGLNQPGRTYEPLEVIAGAHRVIAGWEEGLLLLNEGAKATLLIPSYLAYGPEASGDIQPYSTLIFDLELVKVKRTKHPEVPKPTPKAPVHKKKTIKKS
jgi:FKBP-type peptidyl-prolyl cis-trans isomerase FkpA